MSADVGVDWGDVGYVIASEYREDTVRALSQSPATPSKIAERVDHRLCHVSRALQELRELDLVELLVDENQQKGRIYGLTDAADGLLERMEEVQAA